MILLWCVAMIASGAAVSYPMLLLSRLALGAVVAVASPAVASLIGHLFPATQRGRIYGFVPAGELVGAAVGLLVSGDIAAVMSWRVAFWVLVAPGLLLVWAIGTRLPEPVRGGQSHLPVHTPQRPLHHRPQPTQPAESGGSQQGALAQEIARQHIHPHPSQVLHEDPTGRSLWWAMRYVLSIRTNLVLIIASALGYFFFSGIQTFAVVVIRERFGLPKAAATSLTVVLGAARSPVCSPPAGSATTCWPTTASVPRPIVADVAFLSSWQPSSRRCSPRCFCSPRRCCSSAPPGWVRRTCP